jgi:hypothetical protein
MSKETKDPKIVIFRTTGFQNAMLKLIIKPGMKKIVEGVPMLEPTKKVQFKGNILALRVGEHDEEIAYLEKFMKSANGRKYGMFIEKPKTAEEKLAEIEKEMREKAIEREQLKQKIEEKKNKSSKEEKKDSKSNTKKSK